MSDYCEYLYKDGNEKEEQVRIITLRWGNVEIDQNLEPVVIFLKTDEERKNNNDKKLTISKKITDMEGIYQLYGDSPIYGMNQLLYIGKSNKGLDKRHDSHKFEKRINNLSIRCALCPGASDEELRLIEAILISYHKPSYNSQNINKIGNDFKQKKIGLVDIYNEGNRGALGLIVSNMYF